jgi:Amt family ammonium transporter
MDFAGDTVVHSVGGWAALSGALLLGPRIGKYGKDGKPKALPGHSMPLAFIGLFVLWIGWFGFNPGSTMSFQNPADVVHILVTTNTATIAAVLTATATSWIFIGKPDFGMTVNGGLAGLVAITGGCAFVSVGSSLIIGAIAGVIVVFSVLMFDRIKIDDPVGATSVHLVCGIFGTLCIGLFAQEGVTSLTEVNGLFFGGGFDLLGVQALGVVSVGAFVFGSTALVWFVLKKTMGIRVSREEEIEGLDIGEHGNSAYPDFAIVSPVLELGNGGSVAYPASVAAGGVPVPASAFAGAAGGATNVAASVGKAAGGSENVGPEVAIPVINQASAGAKITKATIVMNQDKFTKLHDALDKIGVTGLTVTNVLGHGMQKGNTQYYRGAPIEKRLLPKAQVDIVVCKVPVETLIKTVKEVLYTGNIGDGKIFIYDVENVIRVRTGKEGCDALEEQG